MICFQMMTGFITYWYTWKEKIIFLTGRKRIPITMKSSWEACLLIFNEANTKTHKMFGYKT